VLDIAAGYDRSKAYRKELPAAVSGAMGSASRIALKACSTSQRPHRFNKAAASSSAHAKLLEEDG
jgi:hypothetical protein